MTVSSSQHDSRRITALAFLAALPTLAKAYRWPNPHLDVLEGMRWDQLGHNSFETALFVTPCDRYIHFSNAGEKGVRTNAADWVRTVSMRLRDSSFSC